MAFFVVDTSTIQLAEGFRRLCRAAKLSRQDAHQAADTETNDVETVLQLVAAVTDDAGDGSCTTHDD